MILLTVGLEQYPFNRLLRAVDELVECGDLTDTVFAQTGHSDYIPHHLESCPFLTFSEMREKVQHADRIICHAGVGTILLCLRLGKHPIVVPRQAALGEQVDDHQTDLSTRLMASRQITVVTNPDQLAEAVTASREMKADPAGPPAAMGQEALERFVSAALKGSHEN